MQRDPATGTRHPGKAGKGPLPKLPGRVLYRAPADRRNPTRATIRSRTAGDRTEPAGARPPHSCEKLTRLRPAVHTPDGAGIGAGHVPRFSPGFVQVSGSAPGPALAGIRGSPAAASRNGAYARTDQGAQTASDGLPDTLASSEGNARHNLSSQNSRERKIGRQGCALLATGSAAGCPN